MQKNERYFLNGIIRAKKPRKILEVGVAEGGGSAIILNAISDIDGAELYSVDYLEQSFNNPGKLSGFLVQEKFPHLTDKWHIFRGGDVSHFIEDIGGDIDMLVLDTMHVHPWETVNFLCVLPFMKHDESWTVLHDISNYIYSGASRRILACRYLFGHVVSGEKISPVSDYGSLPANIGAFRVSEDTVKYIDNVFSNLFLPWGAEVFQKDMEDIKHIISSYYSRELYESFCSAVDLQKYLDENPEKFMNAFRTFVNSWKPGIYKALRRFRYSLRK